jgi:hypothetical protein
MQPDGHNIVLDRPNGPGSLPSAKRQIPDGTTTDQRSSSSDSSSAAGRQSDEAETGGLTRFLKGSAMAPLNGFRDSIVGPRQQFWQSLQTTWKPTFGYPPRGCVMITGLVELETPTAYIVVDTKGHWDPKTKSIHKESLWMGIRRFQYKRQSPNRG